MEAVERPFLESFSALADAARSRLLWLLDGRELTVSELCSVLRLPQSTVSRHLKTLADAGWVSSRRESTSRYYTLAARSEDEPRTRVWQVMRAELAGRPGATADRRRLEDVLARRRSVSRQFFAASAGQWDRVRAELFGEDVGLRGLAGLLPSDAVVGDLGCGTGAVVSALAPWVARVIGVDASEEMLAAARARLGGASNVELHRASLEALPLPNASLDLAVMVLVLHHLPSPVAALAEAARVLAPGGRLLVVDMTPHEHEEYRRQMGHVWLGFDEEQIERLLRQAEFEAIAIRPLPSPPAAKGPGLFAARAAARRRPEPSTHIGRTLR
jgi:ArsR family transcriptional regulator